MFKPLHVLLDRIVRSGNLVFIDAAGLPHRFGDGSGTAVVARIQDWRTELALAADPHLALGAAYIEGRLQLVEGSAYDLVALLMSNLGMNTLPRWAANIDAGRRTARRIMQHNPAWRSLRNVHHHYDIDPRIYDLMLDADHQYSCAYFTPGADLEAAQIAKKRHIAAKLMLAPGQRILDIGSGWGGLGLYLARVGDGEVTGVTLSREQLKIARERSWRAGLANRVKFELEDYRATKGPFHRVVSVGMFEHVGINHYQAFFDKVRDLLTDDGVALIHSIGRTDGPGFTNPFISRYIFPGGYFPALSEVLPAIEQSGLVVGDVEILRLHYAETLRAWRERFMARRAQAVAITGEHFARMWELYLAGSEASFRYQGLMVFQIQLAKRIDTLPLTRDYIYETESRLKRADEAHAEPPRMSGT